jgi:hypothetical protein
VNLASPQNKAVFSECFCTDSENALDRFIVCAAYYA